MLAGPGSIRSPGWIKSAPAGARRSERKRPARQRVPLYGSNPVRPYNAATVSEYRENRTPLVAPGQIDHHVPDMTAAIAADVTLAEVQTTLASASQWLPIDGDASRTIGELVSENTSGPLRLGYGHWRDLILGAQFTNGQGELVTAGGRTVKNVAGYDLSKFMVGQRGVFGTLVTVTVRTYKRPVGAILATFPATPKLISRLIPSTVRPQWSLLTTDALLCGYVGDERTLAYYEATLKEYNPRSIERRTLGADIEHRGSLWRGDFRASIPPAQVSQFLATAKPSTWIADPAFGIVLGSVGSADDAQRVREAASGLGGTVSFPATDSKTRFFDVPPGPQRQLLERLKKSFDPDNRLAPLPWLSA